MPVKPMSPSLLTRPAEYLYLGIPLALTCSAGTTVRPIRPTVRPAASSQGMMSVCVSRLGHSTVWTSRPSGLLPGSRYSEFGVTRLAAAADEDRRPADQARPVLLADAGREPSHTAAVRGDGRKDRRLAGGDGVEGGGGHSEIRRPGSEGRRGVYG